MNNIISLQLLHTYRTFIDVTTSKSRLWTPLLLFFALMGLHIYIGTGDGPANASISGWIIVVIYIVYGLFGLISTRMPSRMEDVLWIYSVPLPFYKIIYACFIPKVIVRAVFWIGSAIVADIGLLFINQGSYHLAMSSMSSFLILVTLEFCCLAASSLRGNKMYTLWAGLILAVLLIFHMGITYLFIFRENSVYIDPVQPIGLLLTGTFSLAGVLFIGAIAALSLLLIYVSSLKLKNKEKLVAEASFWSEFKDFHSLVSSIRGKDRPSWWGGRRLRGIGSFVWFEFAIIRKHLKSVLFQFVLGVLLMYAALQWAPHSFGMIAGLILIASLIGSYFSGLARHAQTGDLFLLPGQLIKKIYTLELISMLPATISLTLLCLIWSIASNGIQYSLFLTVPATWALIIGLRCQIFCKAFLRSESSSVTQYYLILFKYSLFILAAIIVFGACLNFIGLGAYALPISIWIASVYPFMNTYKDVQIFSRRFIECYQKTQIKA
ncbi:sporulation killing factor system integral membrane protein [Paenibacillus larvae]